MKDTKTLMAGLLKVVVGTSFVFILSGCSSDKSEIQAARAMESQIDEMATVIAGGTFLAQQCGEPNMVTGAALQSRVVQAASLKGLPVEDFLDPASEKSKMLEQVSLLYYKKIIEDPNATLPYNINKNCFKLKQMLSPYL